MSKVAFHTLGCKVNQYETEAMMDQFSKKGYEIVDFKEKSDIYIVNTCTVTHLSDRKSRQIIRRCKRLNPQALVVAAGCYAQIAPLELKKIEDLDLIVGNIDKNKMVELVENHPTVKNRLQVYDIYTLKKYEEMSVDDIHDKVRAFIKIQDGCNQYCSYCIIPYARGNIRSRDKKNIIDEVSLLASKGYQEIVLTGIHIASYGKEKNDIGLFELMAELQHIPGVERIRIGSLEQNIIGENFNGAVSVVPKLCPHFHLSLQSGSSSVLRRMNRKYDADEYFEKVKIIRNYFPDASITTDIIVGFPGETDEEFNETLSFVKKVQFSDVHVFKYSKRKGTKAAEMDGQVDEEIKNTRSEILIAETRKSRHSYFNKFIGKEVDVLFESHDKGKWWGHTVEYIKVEIDYTGEMDLTNKIISVYLIDLSDNFMIGKLRG
ncbi:MAG: tRNA (N(6)-L-threonylcarbamoyladenosine(37)-C(2))-methylthiotransferase MtaB [Clostridiales bacterium]|nr:tRNA (N(6)-L-threonylcarbamoyladenosine(37)-C(2))-methylthiotransferase MtaB [Clostridiales bacterium]